MNRPGSCAIPAAISNFCSDVDSPRGHNRLCRHSALLSDLLFRSSPAVSVWRPRHRRPTVSIRRGARRVVRFGGGRR